MASQSRDKKPLRLYACASHEYNGPAAKHTGAQHLGALALRLLQAQPSASYGELMQQHQRLAQRLGGADLTQAVARGEVAAREEEEHHV